VLCEQIQPGRPDVVLVPNGVDVEHFRNVGESARAGSRSLVGFHGAIAEWFDAELFLEVARLCPDYGFELIGPLSVDVDTFKQIPNITCREAVSYEEIPQVISRFDVGILPFKLNPLTHAVRPLKVLEYLAMGVPVVAAPLDEIRAWPGVLFADTPEVFAEQIGRALELKATIASDQEIQDFVAAAAWENTAVPLLERLKKIVNG